MNKRYWTWYLPSYVKTLVYMLQASEYQVAPYLSWLFRTGDIRAVSKRGGLVMTSKAKVLYVLLASFYTLLLLVSVCLILVGVSQDSVVLVLAGIVLLAVYPWILAVASLLPLWIGEVTVQRPRTKRIIAAATVKASAHPGYKIAIAGSFGKTTMKEILKTVLSVKLDTAATPGNLNTPLGTSTFVNHLSGQEEVVIFELGESHLGDVAELCEITQPQAGIITGINEAHLESFGSLDNTVKTIFELEQYLGEKPVYKNIESELVSGRAALGDKLAYSRKGVNGWSVKSVYTGLDGTRFTAHKGATKLELHSGLLGEYQVGPIMVCVDIAQQLGLSAEQIEEGVRYTKPFAHRMQPRQIGGAWVIDDTYNGNSQGVEAGLAFLKKAEGRRKIYVTPGLVEQGDATESVHIAIGKQAAFCNEVVLMRNSVTEYIEAGLEEAGFEGELKIVDDPLAFYQALPSFVATGDVVLMQNDWTDNYA